MLTTKSVGLYDPDEQAKANPKPVHDVNYAGQPMKPGDFYNGRPEHQNPAKLFKTPFPMPQRESKVSHTHSEKLRKAWTPEKRKAYAARMKQWWAARKANAAQAGLNPASSQDQSPN